MLLGLSGELPDQVAPEAIEPKLASIRSARQLPLAANRSIPFDEKLDLLFHKDKTLPFHSNGMRFRAFDASGGLVSEETYFSTGGGFIVREGESAGAGAKPPVKLPFSSAAELLKLGAQHNLAVWQIGLENEKAWHTEWQVRDYVRKVWQTMQGSIERGLATEGILPGGLNVRRRAPRLAKKLGESGSGDPLAPMDWVNVWAMAVNEENAAGGRIVTAPTNGAAGIIPAVAQYYTRYISDADDAGLLRYFLTASVMARSRPSTPAASPCAKAANTRFRSIR
jgi:L-serine dehydratase